MKTISFGLNEEEYKRLVEEVGKAGIYKFAKDCVLKEINQIKFAKEFPNIELDRKLTEADKIIEREQFEIVKNAFKALDPLGLPNPASTIYKTKNVEQKYCKKCSGVRKVKNGKCIVCGEVL